MRFAEFSFAIGPSQKKIAELIFVIPWFYENFLDFIFAIDFYYTEKKTCKKRKSLEIIVKCF